MDILEARNWQHWENKTRVDRIYTTQLAIQATKIHIEIDIKGL